MTRRLLALAVGALLAAGCNTSSTAAHDDGSAALLESQFRTVQQRPPQAGFGPVYFAYADLLAHQGAASDAVAICTEYAERFASIERVRLKEHLQGVGKTLRAQGATAEADQVTALIDRHGL